MNGAGLLFLVKRATVASMTMDTENFGHPISTPFPQPRVRGMRAYIGSETRGSCIFTNSSLQRRGTPNCIALSPTCPLLQTHKSVRHLRLLMCQLRDRSGCQQLQHSVEYLTCLICNVDMMGGMHMKVVGRGFHIPYLPSQMNSPRYVTSLNTRKLASIKSTSTSITPWRDKGLDLDIPG